MPTNIQYRFQQYESAPPADAWLRISERLKEECLDEDLTLSNKFADYTQEPPAGTWEVIVAGIDATATGTREMETTAPVIPISTGSPYGSGTIKGASFRWTRIAAAVVVILLSSALYFNFIRTGDNKNAIVAKVPSKQETATAPPVTITEAPATRLAPVTRMGMGVTGGLLFRKRRKTENAGEEPSLASNAVYTDNSAAEDITYARVDVADQITPDRDITIPTQPIRDKEGNIILDEKLVSASDVNYVTVTGPNGQQTKISKKFLHALSYMNAGSADDEQMGILLQEGALWKWLFQEWRQKLLTQPSFMPSTTNFLDILELKDFLHENH